MIFANYNSMNLVFYVKTTLMQDNFLAPLKIKLLKRRLPAVIPEVLKKAGWNITQAYNAEVWSIPQQAPWLALSERAEYPKNFFLPICNRALIIFTMANERITNSLNPQEGPFRVCAVSYFNTCPLIFQMDRHAQIQLELAPPARLAEMIDNGRAHAALTPSIDYQRTSHEWSILPVAAIGTKTEVLSVRVFSRVPFEQIEQLYCDTESHTSVALVQVIWHLRYGRSLMLEPLTAEASSWPSVLLIGDKVVPQLDRWPYQLDLGGAWCEMTGLPFVFAFWAAPAGAQLDRLVDILRHAAQQGRAHVDQIIDRHAAEHGFKPELARKYLTDHLCFDFGPPQIQALQKFYQLAHQLNLTPRHRPLHLYPQPDLAALSPE
ncbi:MAG: hypothetical protein AMJ79_07915 [Phycisphaerae bacterium SM23_30]|nr:MAG: hypothetical protein AMJ79_07915 [Phycisphaerae bacterium SM23_30]